MTPITVYAKAHAAAVFALVVALVSVAQQFSGQPLSRATFVQVGVAVLTAVGVWVVKNVHGTALAWSKAVVAVVGAVLSAAAPFVVAGHITYAQCVTVAVALLGALSVYVVPNAPAALVTGSPTRQLGAVDDRPWQPQHEAKPDIGGPITR